MSANSNDEALEISPSQRFLRLLLKRNEVFKFSNSSWLPQNVNWIVGDVRHEFIMHDLGACFSSAFRSRQLQKHKTVVDESNRCFFLSLGAALDLNPFTLQTAFRFMAQRAKAKLLESGRSRSSIADKLQCLDTVLDRGVAVDAAALAMLWPEDLKDTKICLITDQGGGNILFDCFTSDVEVETYKEVFIHLCGGHFTMIKPRSGNPQMIEQILEFADPTQVVRHDAPVGPSMQSIVDSVLATVEPDTTDDDGQLGNFGRAAARPSAADSAVALEGLRQAHKDDITKQDAVFRSFLVGYLMGHPKWQMQVALTKMPMQELWEEFYKIRKDLAQMPRKPRTADDIFQALRELNKDADQATRDLVELTIAEIKNEVFPTREMHPEDFFTPTFKQVPFTDEQLNSLLTSVIAPPSLQDTQYILQELSTTGASQDAEAVAKYFFTKFNPTTSAAFVLQPPAVLNFVRSTLSSMSLTAEKLHPSLAGSVGKLCKGFDVRMLKRVLARNSQLVRTFPADLASSEGALFVQQVRKDYWANHKALKFDLRAEVKAAERNLCAYASVADRLYVFDCGFQACYGYRLHLVQLTALAVLILHPEVTRRLLQVLTGEGKSNIIAALAIYLVKCGDPETPYVDIVTTHNHLAKRDAEGEMKRMFDLFSVTVAHNIVSEEDPVPDKARPEYRANVVFGTPDSFIFDVLGTEYYMQGQRADRPFAYCIVDEVDSMFMDKNTDVCRLGSYAVGLSDTILVLLKIWKFITSITVSASGEFHLFSDIKYTKEEVLALVVEQVEFYLTTENSPIVVVDSGTNDPNDPNDPNEQKVCSVAGKKASDPANMLNADGYARDYMLRDDKAHLRTYVDAAFAARFTYAQDLQYVIYHGDIVIQDRKTGQSQFKSQWRDGMHQFLQMKHGLSIKKETLETNLMSCKNLFLRYTHLYGLTGTLGSQFNQAFLASLYNPVHFVCIPSNYAPARLEYPAIRTVAEDRQLDTITLACDRESNHERPVLIVCETIEFAKKVIEKVNSVGVGKRVRAFIFDSGNQDEEILMDCGDIIVATNLLGRGADIKLTERAKRSGGLHVILTFAPDSVRVLLQAFGRCGRKELLGTAQVIDVVSCLANNDDNARLSCIAVPHAAYVDLVFTPEGDEAYFTQLQDSIALLDVQESVFRRYLNLITGSYFDLENVQHKNVPEIFDENGKMDINHPIFRAVEERWAIFYRQYKENPAQLQSQFAAEVGKYVDSAEHGNREAVREQSVTSSGLRIRLINRLHGDSEHYITAADQCDTVLNDDPRNYVAAVQRVYYMLRANTWDKEPVYTQSDVLNAIAVAEELLVAAISREQARHVAQVAVRAENRRRNGKGRSEINPELTADDFVKAPPPEFQTQRPRAASNTSTGSASSVRVAAATPEKAALNPRSRMPKMDRSATTEATSEAGSTTAETTTSKAESNVAAQTATAAAAKKQSKDSSRLEEIPGLETILELRKRMLHLKQAVSSASDIRYVDAQMDPLADRDTDAEAHEEGLRGYPKPVLRNKPKPKKRGSWWPIVVGLLCCCVGGWLCAGAMLGSNAFMAGSMLIGSGISDVLLGVQSLSSGRPVKFGEWIQGKTKVIATAVTMWISKMSPGLAASKAAMVTKEAAKHVTLPDGVTLEKGKLAGVPEAMATRAAGEGRGAPAAAARQIHRIVEPDVKASQSGARISPESRPAAGSPQARAATTPVVTPTTKPAAANPISFEGAAPGPDAHRNAPAPNVDNNFNRPDLLNDLECRLKDIMTHLKSSMPEDNDLRVALRPYRVQIEARLADCPVLLRLVSVFVCADAKFRSFIGEILAKYLDSCLPNADGSDGNTPRVYWSGAVPKAVRNGSGLLPIPYQRTDSNLVDVLCSNNLVEYIVNVVRFDGDCDTYSDLLFEAFANDLKYTKKAPSTLSAVSFKAAVAALDNVSVLEKDWLTIKSVNSSATATDTVPVRTGPLPTSAVLRKAAQQSSLSPADFFASASGGCSDFLAQHVYTESTDFLVELATSLLAKAVIAKHRAQLKDSYNADVDGEAKLISEDSVAALLTPFQVQLRSALQEAHLKGTDKLEPEVAGDKTQLQQVLRLCAIMVHHSPGSKEMVRLALDQFFVREVREGRTRSTQYRLPWTCEVPVATAHKTYLPISAERSTELVSLFMQQLCQRELMNSLEDLQLGEAAAYVVYQNDAVSRFAQSSASAGGSRQPYVDKASFDAYVNQLGDKLLLDWITLDAPAPTSHLFGRTPAAPAPYLTPPKAAEAPTKKATKLQSLPADTHQELERFLCAVTLRTSPYMAIAEQAATTLLTDLAITALVECIQQKQEAELTKYYEYVRESEFEYDDDGDDEAEDIAYGN